MRFRVALVLALCACASNVPLEETTPTEARQEPRRVSPLQSALDRIADESGGVLSVSIRDLTNDRTYGVRERQAMAQQSTFKLWLAVAIAHRIDHGQMTWDDTLHVAPADLIYDYQPIAERVGQGRDFTIAELTRWMIIKSDNLSADFLLRQIGGPPELMQTLSELGVEGIQVRADIQGIYARLERIEAESAPSDPHRFVHDTQAEDPNPASAEAVTTQLARLVRGEILSETSTARLLQILDETETGRHRLRAGLSEGWRIAHKTGTGSTLYGYQLATNDIGILTAPDGARFAVAVFLGPSEASYEAREEVIANVARAIVEHASR